VLKLNPENLEKQQQLVEQVQANKKSAPVQKIVDQQSSKDRKRRRESLVEKEDAYLKKPEIKIPIPDSLKSQLVEDWENVTKNKKVSDQITKLISLPAKRTVYQILDEFFQNYHLQDSKNDR
jgi:mortality factor 4-like protein 1